MKKIKTFLLRILATFVATALSLVGAGAIAGVDTIKSAVVAGIAGIATVLEEIARTYMQKGKLTDRDINKAFDAVEDANQ